MTKAGVGPRWVKEGYGSVHTPEHEHLERQRRELIQRLTNTGLSQERPINELASRLAERVTIASGPEGPYTTEPA
jgi:hypothetical protein